MRSGPSSAGGRVRLPDAAGCSARKWHRVCARGDFSRCHENQSHKASGGRCYTIPSYRCCYQPPHQEQPARQQADYDSPVRAAPASTAGRGTLADPAPAAGRGALRQARGRPRVPGVAPWRPRPGPPRPSARHSDWRGAAQSPVTTRRPALRQAAMRCCSARAARAQEAHCRKAYVSTECPIHHQRCAAAPHRTRTMLMF